METRDERIAFNTIIDLLPVHIRDLILDRARVLHLRDATGAGASRDLLAALMDLAVVDAQGAQAVSTLADLFHRRAGEALGSSIDEWVEVLNSAGLTVIADQGGPVGMRVAARLSAVDIYRGRLAAEAGRVDLALLAEDLPPVIIDDLIGGLKIDIEGARSSDDLLRYLRRWRRMLIVGQPGSGKSVALREIAAHCASHPHAPVPIRVALPRLIKQQPERLTIDGIIDEATADLVSRDQRAPLAQYLTGELAAGRAIVLCDGLDECGVRAPWTAQQLANILGSLHPRAGFVLATRANAQIPAARLGLARVELAPPDDLSKTVDSVLVVCAETRVPEAEREEWLATRRAWIREAKEQYEHLLTVPLLAILLTLICASASDADLPKGRAALLHRAVEQSVHRWEQTRGSLDLNRPWSPMLTTNMLLDGFIVLGRILDGGATPSRVDALQALSEILRDPNRWAMAPAQAHEVAEQVLRFWDEHVAVFVVNATDQLTTRSKVFAEIATAMWARTCDPKQLTTWLTDAATYTDSDGAITLAAGLDPRIVGALLSVGSNGQPDATLMVADLAIRGIAILTPTELERTLGQLQAGVEASRDGGLPAKRGPRNPPSRFPTLWDETREPGPWPFVQAACQLALPAERRAQRADLIADGALDDRSEAIAAALCELSDAATDRRRLGERGAAAVNAALAIPTPSEGKMVRESRRSYAWVSGGHLAPGLAQVALGAARRLDELAANSDERAFKIAMRSPGGTADQIFAALERAGVDTSQRWADLTANMRRWVSAYKDYEAVLLADLASLDDLANGSAEGLWSLTELGDLLAATGYQDVGLDEFRRAFVHDTAKVRRPWLDAIADAYGINKPAVASQARYLQDTREEPRTGDTIPNGWFVAAARPLSKPSLTIDPERRLTTEQQRTLLECLEAHSDWIASAAATVLVNVKKPPWDSQGLYGKDMSRWPRWRAALWYVVAIMTAGDNRKAMLTQAVASDSSDYRYAARMTISVDPDLDSDGSIMTILRRDPDLAVRPKYARKDPPTPAHWTCDQCRAINDVDVEDCPACDHGVRPGI